MPGPILEPSARHGVPLALRGAVAVVSLRRPVKRNALSKALVTLMFSITLSAPEARERVRAFLDGKAAKVQKSS